MTEPPIGRPIFVGESALLGPSGSCLIQEIPGDEPAFVFLVMVEGGRWALGVLRGGH